MTKKQRDIQKEILGKLLSTNGLRYTDARPSRVENDLFNYHLQFLVEKGLVEKHEDDGLYYLTQAGKQYIEGNISLTQEGRPYFRFRVGVLVIALIVDHGETLILSHTRKRHPFYGDTGAITGKVHASERVKDTALRKLEEETGLVGGKVEVKGLMRKIRKTEDGELFFDSFWFICLVRGADGELVVENEFGINRWSTWDEAIASEEGSKQGSKNLVEIYKKLRDKPNEELPFIYFEEETRVPEF
ncbi:NUDIX domain-containing protein [candidate division WWE3 bacterium]|uniref:NUDIX domain-containing protein n=1 Tax=candidate division WWE3 bacterium TaxID=2053526 RepID=A0A955LLC5_UNCKA|nr:NUDIX domain-containing protein [candidate division WWE3 bacterium]